MLSASVEAERRRICAVRVARRGSWGGACETGGLEVTRRVRELNGRAESGIALRIARDSPTRRVERKDFILSKNIGFESLKL